MGQPSNTLYYGDNLDILRRYIDDESVDLIYLDPPFNSQADYNVLFKEASGAKSAAQIKAFGDTWHWNEAAERTYNDLVTDTGGEVGTMIGALRSFIGTSQMMAYLVMMAARLASTAPLAGSATTRRFSSSRSPSCYTAPKCRCRSAE